MKDIKKIEQMIKNWRSDVRDFCTVNCIFVTSRPDLPGYNVPDIKFADLKQGDLYNYDLYRTYEDVVFCIKRLRNGGGEKSFVYQNALIDAIRRWYVLTSDRMVKKQTLAFLPRQIFLFFAGKSK